MYNYETLIEKILEETDMGIALIPHVIWGGSDDRVPLMQLYKRYQKSGRVLLIEDKNCSKLKYIISQCRFFIRQEHILLLLRILLVCQRWLLGIQ